MPKGSKTFINSTDMNFIANVSHEIRTPITAIMALMENVVDGVTPYSDAVGKQILAYADRLEKLVTYMLDLSKLEQGAISLDIQSVKVWDWLYNCVEPLQMLEAHKDLTFEINVYPETLTVNIDPDRLQQAVSNIISNAIRHANEESEILVEARELNNEFVITIFNEGEPISKENEENIFARFKSGGVNTGGTGLGLSIARWVVSLHNGKIAPVEPRQNGQDKTGAMFRISIPRNI